MTEPVLVRRQRAAEACVNAYFGQGLDFANSVHCGAMAAFVLDQLGREATVLRGARFTSDKGAVRWLKRKGFRTVMDAVDACGLERLPSYGFAMAADLLALEAPAGDAFGASLAVCLGPGQALAWGEGDQGASIVEPLRVLASWRAI